MRISSAPSVPLFVHARKAEKCQRSSPPHLSLRAVFFMAERSNLGKFLKSCDIPCIWRESVL